EAAIATAEQAIAGFRERERIDSMIHAAVVLVNQRVLRATREDFVDTARLLDEIAQFGREVRGDGDDDVAKLDHIRAQLLYRSGRIREAHAIYDRLRKPALIQDARRVTGIVVDEQGAPVAGATVTAGCCLQADSLRAGFPLGESEGRARSTTTDASG